MSWDEVSAHIKRVQPKLVVFTTTVPTMDNDCKVASIAKQVSSKIKTMAINIAMQSATFDVIMRYPDLDYAAYQDPEYPVLDIIQNNYQPEGVGGILFRDKDGKTIKAEASPTLNLDELGIPPPKKSIPSLQGSIHEEEACGHSMRLKGMQEHVPPLPHKIP